jgi:hypothetical protein
MIKMLTKKECDMIIKIVRNSDWTYHSDNFKYHQTFFHEPMISRKIKQLVESEKKISFIKEPIMKVIKLNINDSLPTHTQRFVNSDITYTAVCFLNDNFIGGNFFVNNKFVKHSKGLGIIHDRNSTQRITKINEGECYLLFCHLDKIIINKTI